MLLLSRALTDNNNVSCDCVSPASDDQSNGCTSDTEEKIAALSRADEELISNDVEDDMPWPVFIGVSAVVCSNQAAGSSW